MHPRFKADFEYDLLHARKSNHPSAYDSQPKCKEKKLLNTYTRDDRTVNREFAATFSKFLENNVKKVLFRLDNRPLEVRTHDFSRRYWETCDDSKNGLKKQPPRKEDVLRDARDVFPGDSIASQVKRYKQLIEKTKRVPNYKPRDAPEDGALYGKSSFCYKHNLPESSDINPDSLDTEHYYQSINRQRNYRNRSQIPVKDKAAEEKAKVEEKVKKLVKDVGLSTEAEARLRQELEGSNKPLPKKKWYERVHNVGPHDEKYVKQLLKPLMKEGLPPTKDVLRLSTMRFYKRIYNDVLDGCCDFKRGNNDVKEGQMRDEISEYLRRKSSGQNQGVFETAVYKTWLNNLRISKAIKVLSTEFNISFNEFNDFYENLCDAVEKSKLSDEHNAIVKSYCEKFVRQDSKRKSNSTAKDDDGVEEQEKSKQEVHDEYPFWSLSARKRIRVRKSNPFYSYDKHILSATRRRFTLANCLLRKCRMNKVMLVTYDGASGDQDRFKVCDIKRKTLVIRADNPTAVFDRLHERFIKHSATARPTCDEMEEEEIAEKFQRSGSFAPEGGICEKNNPDFVKRSRGKNVFCEQKNFDGFKKENRNSNPVNFNKHDCLDNATSKCLWEDVEDYKQRNYNRIFLGHTEFPNFTEPEMLPTGPFSYKSASGRHYPLLRYESALDMQRDFFRRINENSKYNVGYTLELFYWIRAFFEEYRRVKKRMPPLNYSFRKTFLPDPMEHFCPVAKIPDLDWMILKLQKTERIGDSFGYNNDIGMRYETVKKWKGSIDREKCFLTGIKYYYNMRRFLPFRALPCPSCYPDFEQPSNKPHESFVFSSMTKESSRDKESMVPESKPNLFQKICCGMIENSAGIRPENELINSPFLKDDAQLFSEILKNMLPDIRILGNIHRTQQQKFKENVLAPTISAMIDFFRKYYREYLCLFKKEQTALGYLYNSKVVKRRKDDMPGNVKESINKTYNDSIKIKREPPESDLLRYEASDSLKTNIINGITKKYFSDDMSYDLNECYTFHKFKVFAQNSGTGLDSVKSELLDELLTNLEYVMSEENVDMITADDDIREKVLEKLITQDSDDSEWTILENRDKKVDESFEVIPSDMSLQQYESDSPKSLPEEEQASGGSSGNNKDKPDKGFVGDAPITEPTVVGYATIEQKLPTVADESRLPSSPQTSLTMPTNQFEESQATKTSLASKVSREKAGVDKMIAYGDIFRRSFTFQFQGNNRGFPTQSEPSIQDVPYVGDQSSSDFEDEEVDSLPLSYSDILKQGPSTNKETKQNKIKDLRRTFSALTFPSETSSVLSDLLSEKSEGQSRDYDAYDENADEKNMRDIWFYGKDGKPRKHMTRKKRSIIVQGGKIYPVEGVLTTQWYYSELAKNAAKKKVMHLVLNCWKNHYLKWFKKLNSEKLKYEQNKKKRVDSDNFKEKVFWCNRKICIDDAFRKKVFTPTDRDLYYNKFYKSHYNAVQSWIHKTHVGPDSSGWFEDIRKKEEEKMKELEEQVKALSGRDPLGSGDALRKIRKYQKKRFGSELDAYSAVWTKLWTNWKKGKYVDVYDPGDGTMPADSEDESIIAGDLVLGFPAYLNKKKHPMKVFEEQYETYAANKRFYDEMLQDLTDVMTGKRGGKDEQYIQNVYQQAHNK